MRLLDRYLLRELLVPLIYCLCGFLLFWVVSDLFAELESFQRKKLLLTDIVQYYLVITPEFLVVVLPIALLLAMLYALTNHARHHEITAIRAAGVSLLRLSLPYLFVGLVCSLALLAINELWVPESADAAERIERRRMPPEEGMISQDEVKNLAFNNAAAQRKWLASVYNLRTSEMLHPQVIWQLPNGSVRWITAQKAVPREGGWVFYNVREYAELPGTSPQPMPVLQTNILSLPEFNETPDVIRSEIRLAKSLALGKARKADIPVAAILDYLRLHPNPPKKDSDYLYTKLHGRLAMPWTCMVVVILALPFGAATGRRNVFVGVAASIVICFAYFVIMQLTLALGTGGYLPPWLAAWSPNLLFTLVGLALATRVR